MITNLILDLLPDYIPFLVQCGDGDGGKIDPTADNLIVYEEDGGDSTFSSTTITGSPFDPVKINSKTGLWGVLIPKTAFSAGKFYIALWELTIDGETAAKQDVFFTSDADDYKCETPEININLLGKSGTKVFGIPG